MQFATGNRDASKDRSTPSGRKCLQKKKLKKNKKINIIVKPLAFSLRLKSKNIRTDL